MATVAHYTRFQIDVFIKTTSSVTPRNCHPECSLLKTDNEVLLLFYLPRSKQQCTIPIAPPSPCFFTVAVL
jgi:hypothetical protein